MKKQPKPTLRLFGGLMLRHWVWNIFRPPAATIAGTIEFLLKQSAKTPMTVVLDEFQNAETVEPALVTDLSVLWDKYRKDTQLLLVLTVSDGAGRSMTDERFSPLWLCSRLRCWGPCRPYR